MADVFNGLGVRVGTLDREDFLKVRETLTRMGLLAEDGDTLNQTCFLLHKRGQYAIMHHLEMRMLDGEDVIMSSSDEGHRNTVAHLLDQWELVEVLDYDEIDHPRAEPGEVTVIPYKDKSKYRLEALYQIGRPR